MAKLSYSEALKQVLDKLDEVAVAPGGGAALLVRLDTIDKRGEETVDLLRVLNGCVREHGKTLAAHSQWMESHQSIHKTLDKRVDSVARKANIVTGISGILALIAGALGIAPNK